MLKFTFKKETDRKSYETLEAPEKCLLEYIHKGNFKQDVLILGEKHPNSYLTKVKDAD